MRNAIMLQWVVGVIQPTRPKKKKKGVVGVEKGWWLFEFAMNCPSYPLSLES